MTGAARLVVPALRWDRAHGFRYLDGLIDDALELGVGGFVVDGGPRDEVAALVARLHAGSAEPILVGARAERGAGEAIEGLTQLPPLGAIASVAVIDGEPGAGPSLDVEVVRRAARLTVRELKNAGFNWALAPICDLDVPRGSPSTGMRGAGSDPAIVAAVVSEWVDACQAESVIACAMHFPGVGRATSKDEGAIAVLKDQAATLRAAEFAPFVAAIDAGAGSVMVAPVGLPTLRAPEGAMYSAEIIENLLRTEMHFDGLVVTIPFDREPTIDGAREGEAAVKAIAAGCDIVLAPANLSGVVAAIERAERSGALAPNRVREARARLDRSAGWARPVEAREIPMDDVMWSRQLADRCMRYTRGARPRIGAMLEVVRVAGGNPVDTSHFADVMRALHIDVIESEAPGASERAPLAVLFTPADSLAGNVTHDEFSRLRNAVVEAFDGGRDVVVVAYCHPRGALAIPGDVPVLLAWEPTRAMQQASARALFTSASR